MSVYGGPNRNKGRDLLLAVDAENRRSYSASGSTWADLSGTGNNVTLENSPTLDNTNGVRSFSLNGTTQRGNASNPASLQITVGTIAAWMNGTSGNSGYRGILTKQNAWGLFLYNNELIAYDWGGGGIRGTGLNLGDNTWNHVVLTFTQTIGTPANNAIVYRNGAAVLTTTVKHVNQSAPVLIGEGNGNQYFSGKIAAASIYNRVLTPAEILQNFNALRGRFGL